MAKAIDMTVGSPFKNIFKFAIPIGLGFALQNLYNLGDSLIVSLSRGSNASTGVNLTGSLNFLILGFAQGITAGFGVVLSQLVGAKDLEKMKNSFGTSLILSLIVALLVTAFAVPLARPILVLLDTNEMYLEYSVSYIRAIFSGLVFMVLYNYNDHVLRAMGDSKTPFYILIMCAILNLGLNSLLFVFDSLPVAWAGWATIISQGVSVIIGFIVIRKKFPELHLKKKDFRFTANFAWRHLSMGLPMAMQFVITASGCMVQQQAFNSLPDPLCAMAQGTGSKIDNVFGMFINGAGTAMTTYVGQNYGAKKYDRIKKGYKASFLIGGIFTLVSMTLMFTLSVPFAKLLLPASSILGDPKTVYGYVFTISVFQASFYYFLFLIFQNRHCLQGIGRSTVAMYGGIVEFVARLLASILLAKYFGYIGACLSNPLAWVSGAVYLFIAYSICFKKLEKKEKIDSEKSLA